MRTRGASLSGLPKLEQCTIFSIDKNRSRDYDIFRGVRANGFFCKLQHRLLSRTIYICLHLFIIT